jgi:hypothetical protein
MNIEHDIASIVWKYLEEESTKNELNMALHLFSNPHQNPGLKSVMARFWEKLAACNRKNNLTLKTENGLLHTIHLRMKNPVTGKYFNRKRLKYFVKFQSMNNH